MQFHSGWFLVAKPSLLDPNFRQTVVLLVQHSEEGAFGLVVNRPVPVKDLPYPIFAGGPCEAQGLFLLHGHPDWAKGQGPAKKAATEIAPGIFLGDSSLTDLMKSLPKDKMKRVRMFAGYAGWGPGQLEGELAQGAWALSAADGQTLFETAAKDLWLHLRPPAIPQPSLN
jgi:putative transcriptional regulator